MKSKTNVTDAYEAVLHEVAMVRAETTATTFHQKQIAMRVRARVTRDLARYRRELALTRPADPAVPAKPIE